MTAATAPFAAPSARRGPLTWGQQEIWRAIQNNRPHEAFISFTQTIEIPARLRPLTTDRVARALGRLMERHESLRTVIDGPDHAPEQVVRADGALELTEVEAEPGFEYETAARLAPTLIGTAFDYAGEWPLRVLLIRSGDSVSHVVVAYSHLANDGWGSELARRDLLLLLADRTPRGEPPQPVDLATWQHSTAGLRVAASAAQYWDDGHELSPTSMFSAGAHLPAASGEPVIVEGLFTSRALELAVHELARRTRTSTSTVLLAATAVLVARHGRHRMGAVAPIVGNRFRSDVAELVGSLAQQGLFVLDVGERTGARDFAGLLPAARASAMRAYRCAYHDPVDRFTRPRTDGERDPVQQPFCCLNDQRAADTPRPPADLESVETARGRTRLFWQSRPQHLDCLFCVGISDHPRGVRLTVTADVRSAPKTLVARFGYDLEDLLIAAAFESS